MKKWQFWPKNVITQIFQRPYIFISILGLTYRADPILQPNKVREVFLPEDKLKAGMKERIVASLGMISHKKIRYIQKRWIQEI